MSDKKLLSSQEVHITLHRLVCQLIENHRDFTDTVLIGLQPKGTLVAQKIKTLLQEDYQIPNVPLGYLDTTFYRDDFRRKEHPLQATPTKINFLIENKKVVLIDDVLYTGRSVRAALTALQDFGRPASVELLVLIDRRFSRHLPIQPNYRGREVDAINDELVAVHLTPEKWSDKDQVILSRKNKTKEQ